MRRLQVGGDHHDHRGKKSVRGIEQELATYTDRHVPRRDFPYSIYSYLYELGHAPLWLGGVTINNQQH